MIGLATYRNISSKTVLTTLSNIPTLASIKTYIDQNNHLPKVPSAKEMEKDGILLGEMNMLLLKKYVTGTNACGVSQSPAIPVTINPSPTHQVPQAQLLLTILVLH